MLKVFALSCGALEFDRSLFFPGEAPGTRLVAPVSSYLVVHSKGRLIFDTGVHCDARTDPAGRLGKRIAELFKLRSGKDEDVVSQLALLGLTPADIDYVACSHFHFDHCGCNASFPRAVFLVQRAELAIARSDRNRYNPRDWDLPVEYRELEGEHDVFGDGSVVLLPTPGHTAGHQSMWIRPAGSQQFLMTSDASYTREHLEKTILPGNSYDAPEMARSMEMLRNLRDRKGVTLLYGHDAEQWRALPQTTRPLF